MESLPTVIRLQYLQVNSNSFLAVACDSSMDIGKRADVAIRAAQNSMVHGLQTISVPALNILVLTMGNFDTISQGVANSLQILHLFLMFDLRSSTPPAYQARFQLYLPLL